MIASDQELKITRERVSYLIDLLARLRVSSRPEELALVSSGYRGSRLPHSTVDGKSGLNHDLFSVMCQKGDLWHGAVISMN